LKKKIFCHFRSFLILALFKDLQKSLFGGLNSTFGAPQLQSTPASFKNIPEQRRPLDEPKSHAIIKEKELFKPVEKPQQIIRPAVVKSEPQVSNIITGAFTKKGILRGMMHTVCIKN
jgi:hypothetical protein